MSLAAGGGGGGGGGNDASGLAQQIDAVQISGNDDDDVDNPGVDPEVKKKKKSLTPSTKTAWFFRFDPKYKCDDIARKLITLPADELDQVMKTLDKMKKGEYVESDPVEALKQEMAAAEAEQKAAAEKKKELKAKLAAAQKMQEDQAKLTADLQAAQPNP